MICPADRARAALPPIHANVTCATYLPGSRARARWLLCEGMLPVAIRVRAHILMDAIIRVMTEGNAGAPSFVFPLPASNSGCGCVRGGCAQCLAAAAHTASMLAGLKSARGGLARVGDSPPPPSSLLPPHTHTRAQVATRAVVAAPTVIRLRAMATATATIAKGARIPAGLTLHGKTPAE
jgi:hypothetical protein